MATGDLKNNLRKLIAELKQARFPQDDLDVRGLAHGDPSAFLPILHYVFLDFSCALAQFFAEKDYELYGKNDLRFMEVVYRILRDEFGFKPSLTRGQFLSVGFAERKILLLSDILKFCREKHKQLNPKRGKSDRKEQNQTGASKRKSKLNETSRKPDVLTEKNSKEVATSHAEGLAGTLSLSLRQESSLENKENVEYRPRQAVSGQFAVSDEVGLQPKKPSELIIRTLSSQEGGKLKPVTYTTAAGKRNSNIHTTKSVTWDDQASAVWEFGQTDEHRWSPREQSPPRTSLTTGEPASQSSNMEGVVRNPEGVIWPVPVPVPWTLAPCPSDELLLTPSGKAATHQPIPLSASRGYPTSSQADVSMVDITQSVDVPRAQVMRHIPSAFSGKRFDYNTVSQSKPTSSEEMSLLRQQLQELQEKFDSVVLQNNEMSARVVVLESKVKMLEESASQGNVCSSCRRPEGSVHVSSSSEGVKVVSGFAVRRSSNARDERQSESIDSDSYPTSCQSASRRLDMEKTNQSTKNADCLGEIATEKNSGESSAKPKPNKIVIDLTAASQNLEEPRSPDQQLGYPSTPPRNGKDSLEDSHVVFSPLETPDLSMAYLSSPTKATVTNVHKRLKETREMLMRTNRDFAARFDHSEPEQ